MSERVAMPPAVCVCVAAHESETPSGYKWGPVIIKYCPLHAAAPEMLELLKSCLAFFDDMPNGISASGMPDPEWSAPIRALLAKIEG
jgi:hypothetical protein